MIRIIWMKIKCVFGFCAELTEKEMREKLEVDKTYKVEPLVIKEEFVAPAVPSETPMVIKVDATIKNTKKAEKIVEKIKEDLTVKKTKRHWYNNGKSQKLIFEGSEDSLPKTWKKGKIKKAKTPVKSAKSTKKDK